LKTISTLITSLKGPKGYSCCYDFKFVLIAPFILLYTNYSNILGKQVLCNTRLYSNLKTDTRPPLTISVNNWLIDQRQFYTINEPILSIISIIKYIQINIHVYHMALCYLATHTSIKQKKHIKLNKFIKFRLVWIIYIFIQINIKLTIHINLCYVHINVITGWPLRCHF